MDLRNLLPFSGKTSTAEREESFHHPFAVMQREMNQLFERFFTDLDGDRLLGQTMGFTPKIDVAESDKEFLISAELPGMDEKDIDVTLAKDLVTIRGQKKVEQANGNVHTERAFGSFSRTISLPREIDQEKAEAQIKQGVLTVRVPKTAQTQQATKKIKVRTE